MQTRVPIAEQIFGHNKAPLKDVLSKDFADLSEEVEAIVAKISARPTKVKDDTDFASVGQLAIDARNFAKRLEGIRKDETDPLFKAQKDIKAHFDDLAAKVANAIKPHQNAADDYARAKAAAERKRKEEEAKKLRDKEEIERKKASEATGGAAARAEGRAEVLVSKAEDAEAAANATAADAVRTRSNGVTGTASTRWEFTIDDYDALDLNKIKPFLNRDAVETAIRSLVRIHKGSVELTGVTVYQDTRASFR